MKINRQKEDLAKIGFETPEDGTHRAIINEGIQTNENTMKDGRTLKSLLIPVTITEGESEGVFFNFFLNVKKEPLDMLIDYLGLADDFEKKLPDDIDSTDERCLTAIKAKAPGLNLMLTTKKRKDSAFVNVVEMGRDKGPSQGQSKEVGEADPEW